MQTQHVIQTANLTDRSVTYAKLDSTPQVNQGRISISSTLAVPTSDLTGQTTVYLLPYSGNNIALYNGTRWILDTFSSANVSAPSSFFRLFDVYAYDNAGVVTLETTNWDSSQSTAAITSATAAAPVVITSNGHGLSNGNLVGIAGISSTVGTDATNGVNGKVWTVANVAANTFELAGSVGTSLTAGTDGNWYKIPTSRSTALTTQDGVYVKTGDTTRRYLGTCMTIGSSSGQVSDSETRRLVWNYYNRVQRKLKKHETATSWTYGTDTLRPLNNQATNRVELVIGVQEIVVNLLAQCSGQNAVGIFLIIGITEDGVTLFQQADTSCRLESTTQLFAQAKMERFPTAGFHYYQFVERSESGTSTFYGEVGDKTLSSLVGFIPG